ncbi:MAG: ribokinase [Armatimonadetes bacterium]|nr:ribokinase [Armatimonadota bacterium]
MKVPRLPAPGETVTQGEYCQVLGGKGANTAVAAARAGGRVEFAACLGDDPFGRAMLEEFAADGIGTSHCLLIQGKPTGTALIMVGASGENCIAVAPGSNADLTPERVRELVPLIAGADWVLLQMEIPVESNRAILQVAQENDVDVLLNYAPVGNGELALSPAVSALVVNEVEAAALCGNSIESVADSFDAARRLVEQGPGLVVVTLGAEGLVACDGGQAIAIPAFTVKAVDTTAAGDTFCGALAAALAERRDLPDSLRFASAAAAISVTRMGAQPSIPKRAEIEAFLAEQESA